MGFFCFRRDGGGSWLSDRQRRRGVCRNDTDTLTGDSSDLTL
ncbi:Putative uncharacterized protein [Moritella viscosa]|nr:Putative uncharacterized protein [Moritella viscosa]